MTKEKTPCANRGQEKRSASNTAKGRIGDVRGKINSIKFYPQGVQLKVTPLTKPQVPERGKRGKVSGWSSASRRRMREFMLTHQPTQGMTMYGVTLTIPGPVVDPAKAKELFTAYARKIEKMGLCAVWRMEVQARGMLHWHLIVGAQGHTSESIKSIWWECVPLLDEYVPKDSPVNRFTFEPIAQSDVNTIMQGLVLWGKLNRMVYPGAFQHSCDVQEQGSRGAWLRYMQDHASKAKQEQIAHDVGRQWGVIGRRHFVPTDETLSLPLTDSQKARYLRFHQRLATPSEKHQEAPFGRRLRGRCRRGFRGTSTWFGNPQTLSRIAEWAVGESRPASSFLAYSTRANT